MSYITGGAFRDCGKVVLSVAYNSYAKQYAISNGIAYVERERAVTASGSCGADATWELYSDGALSIRGTGSLTNPTYAGAVAWAAYRESIRTVEIAAGITNLSDFAFFGCTSLTSVIFEDGSKLTTVGGSAFNGCTSLKELTLPQGVKTIYGNAFRGCSNLVLRLSAGYGVLHHRRRVPGLRQGGPQRGPGQLCQAVRHQQRHCLCGALKSFPASSPA